MEYNHSLKKNAIQSFYLKIKKKCKILETLLKVNGQRLKSMVKES